MVWYWPFGNSSSNNRAATAKINSPNESAAAKSELSKARKSFASAVSDAEATANSRDNIKTTTHGAEPTVEPIVEPIVEPNANEVPNTVDQTSENTTLASPSVAATAVDIPNTVEETTGHTPDTTALISNTKAEKVKSKRPGIYSHESVGGRFKHAFKLDHKQHHAQKADAPAMANDV